MWAYSALLLTGTIAMVVLYNVTVGLGLLFTPGGLLSDALGLIGVVVVWTPTV